MRAQYSIALVFGVLFVGAMGQETTAESSGAPAADAGPTTTEKMSNDGAADASGDAAGATLAAEVKVSTAPPDLLHTSEPEASTTVAAPASDTPAAKTESANSAGKTDAAGTPSSTAKPYGGNGSAGLHSSIACVVLSVLPVLFFSS